MSKPARLGKCNAHEVLEQQLTISAKTLWVLAFVSILFFVLCFICKGPTYGIL